MTTYDLLFITIFPLAIGIAFLILFIGFALILQHITITLRIKTITETGKEVVKAVKELQATDVLSDEKIAHIVSRGSDLLEILQDRILKAMYNKTDCADIVKQTAKLSDAIATKDVPTIISILKEEGRSI